MTCQKERTFTANHINTIVRPLQAIITAHLPQSLRIHTGEGAVAVRHDGAETYESCFLDFIFCCTHCGEEHFYAIKIDGKSICKIGQYPSFSRAETASLRKYKKLIPKYYVELTSAINAYSQKMSIAGFVYLRRILEHLVDTKYFALPGANEQARFVEKLEAVEKVEPIIPKELIAVKAKIYFVLSKGVHEYTEDECLSLFEAVLYVISSILDQELYKKEQATKAAEVKQIIDRKLQKE